LYFQITGISEVKETTRALASGMVSFVAGKINSQLV
jgi:hypothetical protein